MKKNKILFLPQFMIIAQMTLREMVRSKVFTSIFVISLFLIAICLIAYSFTFAVPERVAIDFGLGLMSLSSVAIAIFMGVGLINQEVEQRTIYLILARPLSRNSFLLGKLTGMLIFLLINSLILGSITTGLYLILGGENHPLLYWCILFSFLESALCLILVVFFSLLTKTVISVLATVSLYATGHVMSDVLQSVLVKNSPILETIIKVFSWVLPDFSRPNIKNFVIYQQQLPLSYLLVTFIYCLVYGMALMVLSCLILDRKNLD